MLAVLPSERHGATVAAASLVSQRTVAVVSAGRILNWEKRNVEPTEAGPGGCSAECLSGGVVVAESWWAHPGNHWDVSVRMAVARAVLQIAVPGPKLVS